MAKVSVIMPSLNVAAYMEKSLQSVTEQTLRDIEILCIDAGSDDGTWEIITGFARRDGRVRAVRSDKKSYGYQVNLGIKMAQGEYIGVVETDDYIEPAMYERLYACAAGAGFSDIAKGGYQAYWTAGDGRTVCKERRITGDAAFYGKTVKPVSIPFLAAEDWYLWSGIYKKTFLDRNRIRLSETPGAAFQDIGFLHRTNAAAETAAYTDACLYHYCIDREGSSSNSGKTLGYAWQEFYALEQERWEEEAVRALYTRMAKSFVCCCRTFEGEEVRDPAYRERYEWFADRLKEAVADGRLKEAGLPPGVWKRLRVLSDSLDGVYRQYQYDHRHILEKPEGGRYIIFGCGDRGMAAFKKLSEKEADVCAFMDNDERLWGSCLEGAPVLEPQICAGEDVRYMIANESHFEEIHNQLLELGIKQENIGIFW